MALKKAGFDVGDFARIVILDDVLVVSYGKISKNGSEEPAECAR